VPAAIALSKLVSALQFAAPGVGVRVDTMTGEIVEGVEPKAATAPHASSEPATRYRTIGVEFDELEWAKRFCETVRDSSDRRRIETALSGSRPMESFENAIFRLGVAHEWFPFRERQVGEAAKAWLEAQRIPFLDDLG